MALRCLRAGERSGKRVEDHSIVNSSGTVSQRMNAANDWRAFFIGPWRVERVIDDRRGARPGRAWGEVVFTDDAREERLATVCREALTIDYGGRQWNATQQTRWVFRGQNFVEMFFADGVTSCMFELEPHHHGWRARFAHPCGEDRYEGRAECAAGDAWRLIWTVAGPRKDYTLDTHYVRIGAAS